MRISKTVFVLALVLFGMSTTIYSNEIGFSGALLAKYSGTVDLYDDESELTKSGKAFQLYSVLDNFRISYLHYEQVGKYERYDFEDDKLYIYSALVQNDVLLFMYQSSFSPKEDKGYYDFKAKKYINIESDGSQIDFYFNVGVGIYDSVMDYNGMHLKTKGFSMDNLLPIGIAGGIGMKKYSENAFLGLEFLYINKTQDFQIEEEYYSDVDVDVSGLMLFITSGVSF